MKKATAKTTEIFGHSIPAICRWLGREGMTSNQATVALAKFGARPYPTIVRDNLGAGRTTSPRYDETRIPHLNRNQAAELRRYALAAPERKDAAPAVVPVRKKAAAAPVRKPIARETAPAQVETRKIALRFKEGTADKVYVITARFPQRGISHVIAENGRFGSTLVLAQELYGSRADAMAFIEKLVAQKLRKGYRVIATSFPRKAVA